MHSFMKKTLTFTNWQLFLRNHTGSPQIRLEYQYYLSRVFCVSWRPFWIFNTRSASAGTETTEVWDRPENSQILGGSRSLTEDNKVILLELRAAPEHFP